MEKRSTSRPVRGVGYISGQAAPENPQRLAIKSLFLKIFLSFWLAQALIVALVVLATVVFRPQTESPFWDYIKSNTAEQLTQTFEAGGPKRSTRKWINCKGRCGCRLFCSTIKAGNWRGGRRRTGRIGLAVVWIPRALAGCIDSLRAVS